MMLALFRSANNRVYALPLSYQNLPSVQTTRKEQKELTCSSRPAEGFIVQSNETLVGLVRSRKEACWGLLWSPFLPYSTFHFFHFVWTLFSFIRQPLFSPLPLLIRYRAHRAAWNVSLFTQTHMLKTFSYLITTQSYLSFSCLPFRSFFFFRHLISLVSLCDSKVFSGYSLLLSTVLRQAVHLRAVNVSATALVTEPEPGSVVDVKV